MRPDAFHSLSVRRCVRQSTKLWICMRSTRRARRRRNDCSIWARPASRPLVQTLVARKSLSVTPRSAARSPTTDSAAPYIGEESITRPPSSTSRSSVCLRGSRSPADAPTSNARHVPSPTAGSVSPLDGMGRCSIADTVRAIRSRVAQPLPDAERPGLREHRVAEGDVGRAEAAVPEENGLLVALASGLLARGDLPQLAVEVPLGEPARLDVSAERSQDAAL